MIEACRFEPNENVHFAVGVATLQGDILWAGALRSCPLDQFPIGTTVHVHPEYLTQLEARVRLVDEGISRESTST